VATALEIFNDDDLQVMEKGVEDNSSGTNATVANTTVANTTVTTPTKQTKKEAAAAKLRELLHREHEDWYASLSGGQRAKVEIIRKVFLRPQCPGVLLIDEAFAALDPKSKGLVQTMLRRFCANSVLLVIYHQDAEQDCVPAGGFFDDNLRFEGGLAKLVGTCSEKQSGK
jgi:ABC-type transport system involved in cytochrome bd biosynthesis fused ATPase/permease subunit